MTNHDCDFLVIGSGLAGLVTALHLAEHGEVVVATKKDPAESNTNYAQGGIACAISTHDSVEAHVVDTLDVGCGLCDEAVVREVLSAGPEGIAFLESVGVEFERHKTDSNEYDLGKEGGHTNRRVLHAGDITGAEIISCLLDAVHANPHISLLPNHLAIDLVTTSWLKMPGENRCLGCYFLNRENSEILAVRASATVLATGGAGKVYLYTSNPDTATGDGVAMGWRAGLPVKNMEMVQFHPTCLFHPEAKSFLISEAVRGEGGVLINCAGEAFMQKYDSRSSLAPRDIVARAIDYEMKKRGDTCVYLDISHKPGHFIQQRFPNIYAACISYGYDMCRDPVPVVPAAHYFCGGLEADTSGRTAISGLYACGEVACTGLHGANRLASNSLLEALVNAKKVAASMQQMINTDPREEITIPDWALGDAVPSDEAVVLEHNWNEVRNCMWDYVGIVRTNKRLERALRRISNLRQEIRQYYWLYEVTDDVVELRNIAAVAELMIRSASLRRESRGLHYTLDYPDVAAQAQETVIKDKPGGPLISL